MVQFKYTVSQQGKETSGVIEASSSTEAAEKLKEKGGYILELKQRFSFGLFNISGWLEKFLTPLSERMGSSEKIFFTAQLSSMLKAGLSITKAIEVFIDEKQTKASIPLRKIISKLESGKKLSEAFSTYPKIFDQVYINVVRSGEATGKLDESLDYMAKQLKQEYQLASKVKSAMIYPIVVLTAMIGVMSFITLSVVPKIVDFAKNAGAELPQITKILVFVTEFCRQFWPFFILIFLILTIILWRLIHTKKGKRFIDGFFLKIPIIGTLIRRYNQARFTRLLSGFFHYGISVDRAFEILSDSLSNSFYSEACFRMKSKLMLGSSLSAVLTSEKELFSTIMNQVVKGAEKTGVLDETLMKLAIFYEEELETSLNNLTSIIEPILIIFLGIGVIGIALSVIVPIYRVTSQLR